MINSISGDNVSYEDAVKFHTEFIIINVNLITVSFCFSCPIFIRFKTFVP